MNDLNATGTIVSDRFVTTRWSVVMRAADKASPSSEAALAHLCHSYWFPLYAYIRRQGRSSEEGQDLTQEFFARLIQNNFIASVAREKGRFRSFLLVALKRFLINEWQRSRARKRGGGAPVLSLDVAEAEARFLEEGSNADSAEALFERRWALALLDDVLDTVRAEYQADGNGDLFDQIKGFLWGDQGTTTQADIGDRFGMSTGAVKSAVHRLRIRFRKSLREAVGKTVTSPAEVDDELRHLLAVLSR